MNEITEKAEEKAKRKKIIHLKPQLKDREIRNKRKEPKRHFLGDEPGPRWPVVANRPLEMSKEKWSQGVKV